MSPSGERGRAGFTSFAQQSRVEVPNRSGLHVTSKGMTICGRHPLRAQQREAGRGTALACRCIDHGEIDGEDRRFGYCALNEENYVEYDIIKQIR
jgi:hypothetical protein